MRWFACQEGLFHDEKFCCFLFLSLWWFKCFVWYWYEWVVLLQACCHKFGFFGQSVIVVCCFQYIHLINKKKKKEKKKKKRWDAYVLEVLRHWIAECDVHLLSNCLLQNKSTHETSSCDHHSLKGKTI